MQPLIGLVAEYTDIDMRGATDGYYVATTFYVEAVRAAGERRSLCHTSRHAHGLLTSRP
jgi:hypothetical protein